MEKTMNISNILHSSVCIWCCDELLKRESDNTHFLLSSWLFKRKRYYNVNLISTSHLLLPAPEQGDNIFTCIRHAPEPIQILHKKGLKVQTGICINIYHVCIYMLRAVSTADVFPVIIVDPKRKCSGKLFSKINSQKKGGGGNRDKTLSCLM